LRTVPEVVNYQNYVGSASPITFNGLVRHYDMRGASNTADIQVNLLHKEDRDKQSHDVAKTIRPEIQKISKKYGANIKIVEVPPGPPVLSTIVAEVYGPNYDEQVRIANDVQNILKKTDDVVDVDWMVEAPQTEFKLVPDNEKAMLNGIAPQQLVGNLTYLMGEYPISTLYDEKSAEPINMVMKLDNSEKATIQDITALKVKGQMGNMMPISDVVKVERENLEKSIYRKDQKRRRLRTRRYGGRFGKSGLCDFGNGRKIEKNSTSCRLFAERTVFETTDRRKRLHRKMGRRMANYFGSFP
jgi:hypothetical protein